MFLSNKNN